MPSQRTPTEPKPAQSSTSSSSSPITVSLLLALTIAIVAAFLSRAGHISLSLPPAASFTGSSVFARFFSSSSSQASTTTSNSGTSAGGFGAGVGPAQKTTGSTGLEAKVNAGMSGSNTTRTPVYFWSHGGPNIMYDYDHPAYKQLQKVGKEITTKVKPKAVVVLSGHWQAKKDEVEVNTAEITDLIYDFYGFPAHYYKEKYPNVGSKEVADKVINAVRSAGLKISGVKRGLDHGVWASFKCAFEPDENPLNVPVVQLSLFDNEDPAMHYALGAALAPLRDENILIVGSGMAVHNLRDFFFSRVTDPNRPMPYAVSFDEALKEAAMADPAGGEREKKFVELMWRPDARKAHPSFDHLLPFHVAGGAAGEDKGVRLFTMLEGSMGWAQFRYGEVPSANL